jgi:hypothetical protein
LGWDGESEGDPTLKGEIFVLSQLWRSQILRNSFESDLEGQFSEA